jgi:head-tail adaptor
MRTFTMNELSRMQNAQETGMMDTCELICRGETGQDEYGQPVENWVAGATLACGLDNRASSEYRNAEAAVFDARLRLPIETDVSNVDRVRITHRFGILLETPLEFQLTGKTRRGPSGLLVDLRSVI